MSEPSSVVDVIFRRLQTDTSRVVLRCGEQSISNRQLAAAAKRLALALHAHGVRKGMVVAVCYTRCADLVAVLLALWYCGAVYLPLDAQWPLQRLRGVLNTADPGLILFPIEHEALAASLPLACLCIERIRFDAEPAPDSRSAGIRATLPAVTLTACDPAYLLFTSGSSGVPKGVLVSHGNLANLFHHGLPLLQLQPGWRYLCCSALGFDLVFFELLAPLFAGGTLVMADDRHFRDAVALVSLIGQFDIDVVQATPSFWQLLLLAGLAGRRRLPLALSCGEALPSSTARGLLACCTRVWNLYGPTETTLWASALNVGPEHLGTGNSPVSIGRPLPGYRFSLASHAQSACSELVISGKGVSLGYLGHDPEQALHFSSNAAGEASFHSGDCCTRDDQGNYDFHHRLDQQLKVNGYRIEAGEVEALLERMPEVEQACCLAQRLEDGTSRLLAFVVCRKGMPNRNRDSWNRHLAAWLPDWMLPQRYLVVDVLPLTASGKRDHKTLLALAHPRVVPDEAAKLDDEARVAALFCSVLEIDAIAPCESFFDAGGSSMLAATLLLLLNRQFNTQLRLSELLATPPTVRSVCQLLKRVQQS